MDAGTERLVALRVADVMTKNVVTVSVQQPLADVAANFAKHKITAAPVVDQHGVCVGMVSACDFMFRVSTDAEQSTNDNSNGHPTAGSLMSRSVQTVNGGAALVAAARMMCTAHLHHLPVVDEGGCPVGILSTLDVVAAMVNSVEEVKDAMRL
jgi:CBS domain-containing membrane protein